VRTLGTGSFARVVLLKEKEKAATYFACKILTKDTIIRSRQVEHIANERKLLFGVSFPFLVNLVDHFQDGKTKPVPKHFYLWKDVSL
jgi:protein kinase A